MNFNVKHKLFIIFLLSVCLFSCRAGRKMDELYERFDGKYGQVEIGSHYVGAEFHHSRPVPSRISFYYPVANSIDNSTGYWERDLSLPLTFQFTCNGKTDTLGLQSMPYKYTPWSAIFSDTLQDYCIDIQYEFFENMPVMVLKMELEKLNLGTDTVNVLVSLNTTLRTSHSYQNKTPASVIQENNALSCAYYSDTATDSIIVYLADVSDKGSSQNKTLKDVSINTQSPVLQLTHEHKIKSGEKESLVYLIGTCKQSEKNNNIHKAKKEWEKSTRRLEDKITNYAFNQTVFDVPDPELKKNVFWSKAMIASLQHYIDGDIVPMPCPAEYNFFFTHDLLVNDLGAMIYDTEYVKSGYEFLLSKTKSDSILPHAYYWKDNQYITEQCFSDNWNHLWFIISASAYLKHSNDKETVEKLYPILKKSLNFMLQNMGKDHLMYAKRPDWWDIGDKYGARAYITILTIRALEDFSFISSKLGKDKDLDSYIKQVSRMKSSLSAKLWNEKQSYLVNFLDESTLDYHYYSGSLMACVFDAIGEQQKSKLLQTAKNTLLDEQIGIRNAWPPDFHTLIDLYHFKDQEVGEPYYYFNAGVWPQGNAWYALGLIASHQLNEAKHVIKKYMTIDGIRNSPHGQPSFYEYRVTDPQAPNYGAIDKPTFLWAAGWYMHVLYQLSGLRNNPWHLWLSPEYPDDFENVGFDAKIKGDLCRVSFSEKGLFFKNMNIDGQKSYSAVIYNPAKKICLERGRPGSPYLAYAEGQIHHVVYDEKTQQLRIDFNGIKQQNLKLDVISPFPLKEFIMNGQKENNIITKSENGIYTFIFEDICQVEKNQCIFQF